MNNLQDLLRAKISKGKEVHRLFVQVLEQEMLISGQKPEFWKEKFSLSIDIENLNPTICRQLDQKLLELTQEATFHLAAASAKLKLLRSSNESTFRNRFFEIITEYKANDEKLPAKDTIENMARNSLEDIEMSTTIAETEKEFWKDILEGLSTCRKLIENATWNNKIDFDLIGGKSNVI